MHLAILSQYYPPEIGAPQSRLAELASAFVSRGHTVTVLTAMPNYPTGRIHPGYGGVFRREDCDGVRVVRTFIYPTQRADYARRLANYFSFVCSSAVAGTFALGRPDFLLVESPPLFLGLAGVWLAARTGARLVFNVSDLWPESAVRVGVLRRESLAYRMSARLEATCYKRAWLVSGQSAEIVGDVRERFPGVRTYHLSNGVDTSAFGPNPAPAARAALGAGGDGRCVVLYAGLHGLAQGLDAVLAAADALRGEDDVSFALVGDGPAKPALMAAAAKAGLDNVRFLDPRPRARVASLLAAADIVVVPLRGEIPGAVPSKLYEAMASARPVVLAAGGEAATIVNRHRAGLVVPPGDAPALARAIRQLRDDPNLRVTLGRNGRAAAVALYDRHMIGERFAALLEAELPGRVVAAEPGVAAAGRA